MSDIILQAVIDTNCTCLWDLDQLIGEQGWDERTITVYLPHRCEITALGKHIKRDLRRIDYSTVDPRDLSYKLHQKNSGEPTHE